MQYDLSRELSGESKTRFHESQDYVEGKELESGVTLRCTKGRGKGQLRIVWRGARMSGAEAVVGVIQAVVRVINSQTMCFRRRHAKRHSSLSSELRTGNIPDDPIERVKESTQSSACAKLAGVAVFGRSDSQILTFPKSILGCTIRRRFTPSLRHRPGGGSCSCPVS